MDETCLLIDGSNGNQVRCPTVTYYEVRFPQLGKAMPKSALTTPMISGSLAAGKAIPPTSNPDIGNIHRWRSNSNQSDPLLAVKGAFWMGNQAGLPHLDWSK